MNCGEYAQMSWLNFRKNCAFNCAIISVSYTHLDVYKRQITDIIHNGELHGKMDQIVVEELHLGKLSLLSFAV